MSPSEALQTTRSLLFAPGDSPRKLEKALASAADVVLADLEDSVTVAARPAARETVAGFLADHQDQAQRLWVRINPLDGPDALVDLAAIVAAGPAGVMLPKADGPDDVRTLDHYLSALESAAGRPVGRIAVIVVATETPRALFALGGYGGAPRLAALTWGAEDLATALGASTNRDESGAYEPTYQLARSLCLAGAAAASRPAIETIHADFRDQPGLERVAAGARRAGFSGMMAIHPDQIETINAAFTPNASEIAEAEAVVSIFAESPDAGTVGMDGKMYDRPHLVRAERLLQRAKARSR